jgi:hypothetical protein
VAAGVAAIAAVLKRYPELLHLEDDAGMSLAMQCCVSCVALAATEGNTADRQDAGGTLKLLAAGAGRHEYVKSEIEVLCTSQQLLARPAILPCRTESS